MLANNKLKAFIPTLNPGKAKLFYRDILGLTLLSEDDFGLDFNTNGTVLRVNTVRELNPQEFTILGWIVNDISLTVKSLNKKNVFCEKYNFLNQDNLGIWVSPNGSKVAWFKDPDGNILSPLNDRTPTKTSFNIVKIILLNCKNQQAVFSAFSFAVLCS